MTIYYLKHVIALKLNRSFIIRLLKQSINTTLGKQDFTVTYVQNENNASN